MKWSMVMVVGALTTTLAGNALAQSGLEITPIFGYRWGGGLSSINGLRDFDTKDNISYGVGLGKSTPRNTAAEITYTHFSADVEATTLTGAKITGGPINRDDIMLNGYWYAYQASGSVKPYFTAGLGCSIFSSDKTSTVGRFAWDVGVGIRKDVSDKVAIRVQGLWMPTWVTTGTGVWCDPFYCYTLGTGEYYDQFEVSGGLTIKM